jgi:hypothetical protein
MTGSGRERGEDIELSGLTIADYEFIAHAREDIFLLLDEWRHPNLQAIAARHAAATPPPWTGVTVYASSADREFVDHCWEDVKLLLAARGVEETR